MKHTKNGKVVLSSSEYARLLETINQQRKLLKSNNEYMEKWTLEIRDLKKTITFQETTIESYNGHCGGLYTNDEAGQYPG